MTPNMINKDIIIEHEWELGKKGKGFFSNKRMTRESVRWKMSSKYTIFYHVNNYLNVEILH